MNDLEREDEWIDRELERLLDVRPTLGFVSRVESRIAQERHAKARRRYQAFTAATIAAALGVAVLVWRQPAEPQRTSRRAPSAMASAGTSTPAAEAARLEGTPREASAPKSQAVRRKAVASVPVPKPEIVVDPGDLAALRRYVASGSALPEDALTFTASGPIEPLEIAGLEIPPLAPLRPLDEDTSGDS